MDKIPKRIGSPNASDVKNDTNVDGDNLAEAINTLNSQSVCETMPDVNNSFTGWETFHTFGIDGTLDEIQSYKQKWSKSGLLNADVECRIAYDETSPDANPTYNGEVYWTGSDSESGGGPHTITASATATPIPSEVAVPLKIQMQKTSGIDITSARNGKVRWN